MDAGQPMFHAGQDGIAFALALELALPERTHFAILSRPAKREESRREGF
jgi:hypothetical protein